MNVQPLKPELAPHRRLAARLEPFDSYWQAPKDVESGFDSFAAYYRANYLAHLPAGSQRAHPGDQLRTGLSGECARAGGLSLASSASIRIRRRSSTRASAACLAKSPKPFRYLERSRGQFDVIIPEQELNHLTHEETIEFLQLCHAALKPGGRIIVYAMNGANPFVGAENLAHNIDHFYIVTEYSLTSCCELGGFRDVQAVRAEAVCLLEEPAELRRPRRHHACSSS